MAASSETLELRYWNGRGLAETGRLMLAIAGKFPGKGYIDKRVTTDPMESYGEGVEFVAPYASVAGTLDSNLGRLPILGVGNENIGQSAAIDFYLATTLGFLGDSALQGAQIMCVVENVRECMRAFRQVLPYGKEPTEEALTAWFDTNEATDLSGPAVGKLRSKRACQWYMGRLEKLVGAHSKFAVGTKLSLADVVIFRAFAETMREDKAPKGFAAYRRFPFGDERRSKVALNAHPRLKAICEAVAGHPNVMKWYEMQGPQRF